MADGNARIQPDLVEDLVRAMHLTTAASLAVRGMKTIDGMTVDEAYDAVHEMMWDASSILRKVLHAQDPEGFPRL